MRVLSLAATNEGFSSLRKYPEAVLHEIPSIMPLVSIETCQYVEPTHQVFDNAVSFIQPNGSSYGRLGNTLIVIEHMIMEAVESNCLILLPSKLPGLHSFTPSCNLFNVSKSHGSRLEACLHASPKHFFQASRTSSGTSRNALRVSHGAVIDRIFEQYLSSNATHVYGLACPDEDIFSIHIRSGDVTRGTYDVLSGQYLPGTVHKGYAPYPTRFYSHAIRSALYDTNTRVIIFCQDLSSPGCGAFETLRDSFPRVEMRVGKSLLDDLRLLACSNSVAISAGTFFKAITIGRKKHIHTYDQTSSLSRNCTNEWFRSIKRADENLTKYFISDDALAAVYLNGTKIWKNNDYQRYLVNKGYMMSTSACHRELNEDIVCCRKSSIQ